MNITTETFQYGNHEVIIETGGVARQASGAVMISMGDTMLLVTVVGKREAKADQGFFPLTVNYQEKTYAAGKIPGGYFKREGRPTEVETLTSRLIDRPIRPLFPEGFKNEVQIIATVVSSDPEIPADVPAMIGASAALAISGMPFAGPIAAARVAYMGGEYKLNPSPEMLETSQLDLIVAGTKDAVLMVESEAKVLSEEVMLGAVMFGHEQMQVAIDAINSLTEKAGKPRWDWQVPAENTELKAKVAEAGESLLRAAYQEREKTARVSAIKAATDAIVAALVTDAAEIDEKEVRGLAHALESDIVRQQVLKGEPRIDGRNTTTVRPISVELGVLPRAHGSAIFTRGETQALVVTTLGTERDAQTIDGLGGDKKDNFMLHYNFPPYSVGETGFMSGPKRREIGHGKLAKRALGAVLPTMTEFPYVLRVVSEVTESNGSSSMATVCGGSLAMMDAGVPLKDSVAGIAMGLIKEGDEYAVLTDILGDEDHLGDMDFKVAGTTEGVTALQMDIKIDGITKDIMEKALDQAKNARVHILGIMQQALSSPREEISFHAPRIMTIKIHPDKIRDVIGKGGATIRALSEETNATIDISDDGLVKVAAVNSADAEKARTRIEQITADAEVDKIYEGKVVKIVDFGAFIEILPGKQGLLHVSEIRKERVENVSDEFSEGDAVTVKCIEVDRGGRIRLSMKALAE